MRDALKHTQGPWSQDAEGNGIKGPDNRFVAIAHTAWKSEAEIRANGRLIAASPEMLHLLQACAARIMAFDHVDGDSELLSNIREVINRASGSGQ